MPRIFLLAHLRHYARALERLHFDGRRKRRDFFIMLGSRSNT